MDSMDSMYDVLLQLPLFQGVSRAKISELIEKTKFHFLKYKSGEQIVSKGEECTHLKFLISGCVRSEMVNKAERFVFRKSFALRTYCRPITYSAGIQIIHPISML